MVSRRVGDYVLFGIGLAIWVALPTLDRIERLWCWVRGKPYPPNWPDGEWD